MPFRQASDRAGDGRRGSEGAVPAAREDWPLNVRWITREELEEMYPSQHDPLPVVITDEGRAIAAAYKKRQEQAK